MIKHYLSKILPVLALSSLLSFIYVNIDFRYFSMGLSAEKPQTEQAKMDDTNREPERDPETPAISTGILSKILGTVVHRFLPVSNQITD